MTKSRTAEASLRVFPPDSAEAKRLSPEDSFPAVPMTSRLIDHVEPAQAKALQPESRAWRWFASAERMRAVMVALRVEGLAQRRAGKPSMQLNV